MVVVVMAVVATPPEGERWVSFTRYKERSVREGGTLFVLTECCLVKGLDKGDETPETTVLVNCA